METTQAQEKQYRIFLQDFEIKEAGKESEIPTNIDKLSKRGKLIFFDADIFQTKSVPDPNNANQTIKALERITAETQECELLKTKIEIKGTEARVVLNTADGMQAVNVFSLIKLYKKESFEGFIFPQGAEPVFKMSHSLSPETVSRLGFPVRGTIMGAIEYFPD